jgi:hypothetical protein
MSPSGAVTAAPRETVFQAPAPVAPAPVAPAPVVAPAAVDVPPAAPKPASSYTVWSSSPGEGDHFGPKD